MTTTPDFGVMHLDFSARLEKAIFVFVVLPYTITLLGLAALGAHGSRVGDRRALDDVLRALQGPLWATGRGVRR